MTPGALCLSVGLAEAACALATTRSRHHRSGAQCEGARVRPFGLERTGAQYRPNCFPHRGAPPRTSRTFVNGRTFEAHRVMLVATSGYIKGSLVGAGATMATVSTLDVRFPDAPSSDRARRAMRNSQHCRCGSGSRLKRRARGIIMNFRSIPPPPSPFEPPCHMYMCVLCLWDAVGYSRHGERPRSSKHSLP